MDQDVFAATQFALTPSILPAEMWIPDVPMTVKVYPSIYITTDFEKSPIPMYKPESPDKNCRYRRCQDSFEQCLKVTVGILRAGAGGDLKSQPSLPPKVILYERLW